MTPLKKVYLRTPDLDKPIPARLVGIKKDTYVFEPLRVNFGQFKNGSKLLFVRFSDIESGDVQIIERKNYVRMG